MPLADLPALLDRLAQSAAEPDDRETLEALVERFPGYATAHVALAYACEQEGLWENAHRSWKRARLLLPSSPVVREGLRRTAAPAEDHSAEAASDEAAPGTDASDDTFSETPQPPEPGESLGELAVQAPSSAEDADLDNLIEELEGARIEPSTNPDDVPAPDLDADSDVVSPTLARIYEAQGQLEEAARVHRRLAEEHPDEAEAHRRQAEALDARAAGEKGDAEEREKGRKGEEESG